MILLDTHIWVWLVTKAPQLTEPIKAIIEDHIDTGLGLSVISCWEVSKLVERGRISFSVPLSQWMEQAFGISWYPAIRTYARNCH